MRRPRLFSRLWPPQGSAEPRPQAEARRPLSLVLLVRAALRRRRVSAPRVASRVAVQQRRGPHMALSEGRDGADAVLGRGKMTIIEVFT